MIRNLNSNNFSNYGIIHNSAFKKVCTEIGISPDYATQLNLVSKSIKTMLSTPDSPTVLELLEGLALLCVSKDPSSEPPEIFLLDKTVSIYDGIYYNVLPLYGVCSIHIGKIDGARIIEYQLDNEIVPLGIYPRFNINKVYTLFYQEMDKGFLFKGERHNFWELTYVDKGVLHSAADGTEYTLLPGEFMFYGENQYHAQHSKDENVSFITITFDMNYEGESILCDRIFTADEEVRQMFKNIIQENDDGLFGSDDIILCILKILIIKLLRNRGLESTIYSSNIIVKNKIENSLVSKAADYIKENIAKKLAIADIASYVHLSQSHLSTIFKKNMDMTIIDYINKCRLEESKKLLEDKNYTITEISEMLGYTSIHYFSRQFKAHFGISPNTYRDSHKHGINGSHMS